MKYGVAIFPTDYAIRPDEVALAAEDRGFESIFFPEHTHIPTSRRTVFPRGGELPRELFPYDRLLRCAHNGGGGNVPDDYIKDVKRPEDFKFKIAAKDRLIVGSPKDCLDQLQMWKEAVRPDYLILRIRQPGGPSHEKALHTIRAFGESVIPRL
jgi:alkanesulfonate monooxygenase SsuD/methylene tetrahydromethanopterin reductase-like flavin-dependent oxidoreductase (luciferase family)